MPTSVFLTTVLPIALFVIMAGLGLSLTLEDFRRVVAYPRGIAVGLFNLLLLSPFWGFLVATLFGLQAELAVGLVMLAASPGGVLANLLTHLARGDVALSVSLTALSSAAAVITAPLYLALSWQHFIGGAVDVALPIGPIVLKVMAITLVPLSLGMVVRARATAWALRAEPWVKRLAFVFFVVAVVGAVRETHGEMSEHALAVGGAAIALNLLAMGSGYLVSRRVKVDSRQSTAVAIELGLHNTTVAMAVGALLAQHSPLLIVPAAIYAIVMWPPAFLFVWIMSRRNRRA